MKSTNQRLVSLEAEKMRSMGLFLPHWYSREDIFVSDHWDRLQTVADLRFFFPSRGLSCTLSDVTDLLGLLKWDGYFLNLLSYIAISAMLCINHLT